LLAGQPPWCSDKVIVSSASDGFDPENIRAFRQIFPAPNRRSRISGIPDGAAPSLRLENPSR
jgi:hypothetical protein